MSAIVQVNPLFGKRTFWYKLHGFFTDGMPFLSASQQHQSGEGNSKHRPHLRKRKITHLPCLFLIHQFLREWDIELPLCWLQDQYLWYVHYKLLIVVKISIHDNFLVFSVAVLLDVYRRFVEHSNSVHDHEV